MNKLIWLTLLAVATLNYSCSKEDPFDEKSETGKTSLFDKVTNPETSKKKKKKIPVLALQGAQVIGVAETPMGNSNREF